jgi:zinc protease
MINRSLAPLPTEIASFDFPKVQQFTLSNGIKIYFVHKNNLPVVSVSLLVEAGSKFDPVEKKGLAYLTSLLLDEGAGEFDAIQLSDEFEKLGSMFSVSADQDHMHMSLLSLTENFERSLYLFGRVLTEPRFEQNEFEREKKKLLDRILQLTDDAGYIASTVFEKLILHNSPYELPEMGYAKTVKNISNDDIINYYKKNFSNQLTSVIVVGNFSTKMLSESLEYSLGKWQVDALNRSTFIPPSKPVGKYYIIDKKDSAQCEIRVGHISSKRTAPDFYATRIMNNILGGQFSSRINLNLREAKGFTYGATSAFSHYKDAGIFGIHTAVNIENTAEAVKEILKEIDGIRLEITKKEIDFAKSSMIKQYPSRFETYSQIARSIETLIVHSLSFAELENYISIIERLTDEEIIQAARKNILPDDLVIVLCGEKDKIMNQLKAELNTTAIMLNYEGEIIN